MSSPGKRIRAPFLYDNRPIVLAPIDDYFLYGPHGGLENRSEFLSRICGAGADAVLTFAGAVQAYPDVFARVPTIVNLTASTTLGNHPEKRLVHTVALAVRLHAAMVAVHINLGGPAEGHMLEIAGSVVSAACQYDLPVLGIVYPRRPGTDGDDNFTHLEIPGEEYTNLILHCVSVASDLGVDVIKTHYTGNASSFKRVTEAAGRTPLLISGGPLSDENTVLRMASEAYGAGARGISYGRNLFGRSAPADFVKKARRSMELGQE